MPAALPTVNDLYAMLYGAGVISANPPTGAQASLDYAGELAAAIEDFERATGYIPFLADTVDVTLTFSPGDIDWPPHDYPHLDFGKSGGPGGIVSVTSLRTGVSQSSSGTLLTQGVDYVLRPANAALKSRPYTYLEFIKAPQFGYYGLAGDVDSIKIVGKRGYWSTVPDLAFQGMLAGAARRLVPALAAAVRRGASGWKEGDVSVTYGAKGPFSAQRDDWEAQEKRAIARFRRVAIF